MELDGFFFAFCKHANLYLEHILWDDKELTRNKTEFGLMTTRYTIISMKYSWHHKNKTYVLNEFLTSPCSCATKCFWKTILEDCSTHLYASFETFCVQIGQILRFHARRRPTASSNRFKTNPIPRKMNFCMISLH